MTILPEKSMMRVAIGLVVAGFGVAWVPAVLRYNHDEGYAARVIAFADALRGDHVSAANDHIQHCANSWKLKNVASSRMSE